MARISTSFKRPLRPLKRLVGRLCEAAWTVCFALAGRRTHAALWHSGGGLQVLVLAPHPDDEIAGCAGTLLKHLACGDRVCVAIATDGRQSRVIDDPDAMALRREAESIAVAALMGIQRLEWIGLREGEWEPAALTARLATLIAELRPHVIYAPSRIDFHPEHWRAAHALAGALAAGASAAAAPRVRLYSVQVPLGYANVNLITDVSALTEQCAALTRAYETQQPNLHWLDRRRRYGAALQGLAGRVEEFWEMTADQYALMHAAPVCEWPAAFRGLRNFPATDPLAYWVGRRARRRLAQGAKQLSRAGSTMSAPMVDR